MRARSLTLAALCALSCRNDLPPSWKLTGLRVVAITLDPPEIMPGQTAHVRVVTVDTERRALSLRWVACPPTVAALTSGNFQCASPLAVRGEGAEFDLTAPRIPGNFTTVPVALRVAVCAGGAVTLDADGVSHCAGSDSWGGHPHAEHQRARAQRQPGRDGGALRRPPDHARRAAVGSSVRIDRALDV